jgi:pimeloyl-ACP methyl ester carboxylesterase
MGGMISQIICIEHPTRVRSLTSIMSSTGARRWELLPSVAFLCRVGCCRSPPFPADEDDLDSLSQWLAVTVRLMSGTDNTRLTYLNGRSCHDIAQYYIARHHRRHGVPRQTAAIDAAPARDDALTLVGRSIPVLIAHGKLDPLVPVANAHHMYQVMTHGQAIGAHLVDLLVVDNMGHDLPDQAMPVLVPRLLQHLQMAEARWKVGLHSRESSDISQCSLATPSPSGDLNDNTPV